MYCPTAALDSARAVAARPGAGHVVDESEREHSPQGHERCPASNPHQSHELGDHEQKQDPLGVQIPDLIRRAQKPARSEPGCREQHDEGREGCPEARRTRRGRVATAPTTSTAKAAAASRALVWSKLGWPITPASPATVAVSVVQESATNLTTSIGRVGRRTEWWERGGTATRRRTAPPGWRRSRRSSSAGGTIEARRARAPRRGMQSPTGWEATETVSNIAAVMSPRRSRRSSTIRGRARRQRDQRRDAERVSTFPSPSRRRAAETSGEARASYRRGGVRHEEEAPAEQDQGGHNESVRQVGAETKDVEHRVVEEERSRNQVLVRRRVQQRVAERLVRQPGRVAERVTPDRLASADVEQHEGRDRHGTDQDCERNRIRLGADASREPPLEPSQQRDAPVPTLRLVHSIGVAGGARTPAILCSALSFRSTYGTPTGVAIRSSILSDGRRGLGILPERRCGGGSTASVADDAVPRLGGGGRWHGAVFGRQLLTSVGTAPDALGGDRRPRGARAGMGHAAKGAERGRLLVGNRHDRARRRAAGRMGERQSPARGRPRRRQPARNDRAAAVRAFTRRAERRDDRCRLQSRVGGGWAAGRDRDGDVRATDRALSPSDRLDQGADPRQLDLPDQR